MAKASTPPGAEPPRSRRAMWEVTDAAYPQHVFLVLEDASQPTRAQVAQGVAPADATHTRWHAHVVSAEFQTLLRQSSLPGPLGSAANTPGPGAWVQRGAQVTLDGLSFRVRVRPPGVAAGDSVLRAVGEHAECLLNIGHVVVGADRVVGGLVEIQYLPVTRLPPDSSFLGALLVSLLPPAVVPLVMPVPPALPVSLERALNRTMLVPEQLAEVVPASTQAWRAAGAPPGGAPGFGAWDEPASPSALETLAGAGLCRDDVGWDGVETRRRLSYVHLTMLRAEGLA